MLYLTRTVTISMFRCLCYLLITPSIPMILYYSLRCRNTSESIQIQWLWIYQDIDICIGVQTCCRRRRICSDHNLLTLLCRWTCNAWTFTLMIKFLQHIDPCCGSCYLSIQVQLLFFFLNFFSWTSISCLAFNAAARAMTCTCLLDELLLLHALCLLCLEVVCDHNQHHSLQYPLWIFCDLLVCLITINSYSPKTHCLISFLLYTRYNVFHTFQPVK